MNAKTKKYGVWALAIFGALALAAAIARAMATQKTNPSVGFTTALQTEVKTVTAFG